MVTRAALPRPQRRHSSARARSRRTPARELPAVVTFQQFARFERVDHAQNCARFYALSWQPLLWSGGALVRQ
jgi:hypothetical protein